MGRRGGAGLLVRQCTNPVSALTFARNVGFCFIVADPVLNDAYVETMMNNPRDDLTEPFSWFDLAMPSREFSCVVGVLRDLNMYLEGTNMPAIFMAEKILRHEIEFAGHISLHSMLVELKKGRNYTNLARIVHSFASTIPGGRNPQQFWVKVPITFDSESRVVVCNAQAGDGPSTSTAADDVDDDGWPVANQSKQDDVWCLPSNVDNRSRGDSDSSRGSIGQYHNSDSAWTVWNKFRTTCNYEPKVMLSLQLTEDLPEEKELKRWLGEPVKSLFIPLRCFMTNAKSYPILSKAHQKVVKQFLELGAQVVIDPETSDLDSIRDIHSYRYYIDFLANSEFPALVDDYTGVEYICGYQDYLQVPLQPLQDNLESQTYEVFEKDPVKYELYAQAVEAALLDMVPEEEKDTRTVVVMVVGAGRGPLVRSSFRAAKAAKRKIRIYAVEKNRNAANTLHHLNIEDWNMEVTVVNVDMREWKAPELADIMVSELLGSFGDNELSPECLDGAQKFLREGGVMIPQSYRSYLCPVMSSKLYNECRKLRDAGKNLAHFETPYIVHMKNFYMIDKPRTVFSFEHPKQDQSDTNERYVNLLFSANQDCVLHGFGGYFEATLYGKILMSILPATFSRGMFSWFPMFFPIREPIDIRKGNSILLNIWRCAGRGSVWYEWSLSSPVTVPVHNANGVAYSIGL